LQGSSQQFLCFTPQMCAFHTAGGHQRTFGSAVSAATNHSASSTMIPHSPPWPVVGPHFAWRQVCRGKTSTHSQRQYDSPSRMSTYDQHTLLEGQGAGSSALTSHTPLTQGTDEDPLPANLVSPRGDAVSGDRVRGSSSVLLQRAAQADAHRPHPTVSTHHACDPLQQPPATHAEAVVTSHRRAFRPLSILPSSAKAANIVNAVILVTQGGACRRPTQTHTHTHSSGWLSEQTGGCSDVPWCHEAFNSTDPTARSRAHTINPMQCHTSSSPCWPIPTQTGVHRRHILALVHAPAAGAGIPS